MKNRNLQISEWYKHKKRLKVQEGNSVNSEYEFLMVRRVGSSVL